MTSDEIRQLAKKTAQNCKLKKSAVMLHKREKRKVDTRVPVLSITGLVYKKLKETNAIVTDNADIWVKEAYPIDGWILESYFYVDRSNTLNKKIARYNRYYFVLTSSGDIKVLHVCEDSISNSAYFSCSVRWVDAEFAPADDSNYFANSIYYLDWDNTTTREQEYKESIVYWNYYCSKKSEHNTGEGIYKKLSEMLKKSESIAPSSRNNATADIEQIANGGSNNYTDDDLARIFRDE